MELAHYYVYIFMFEGYFKIMVLETCVCAKYLCKQ